MDSLQQKLVEEKEYEYSLAEVLRLFAYGTSLREALERTAKSNRGALIVLSENAKEIADGGFLINSRFTSQKLSELAKMDGAIIIDSKLKKIMYANTLLVPDSKIKTDETGTKHRAAERTAKQLGVIVIAVSEKSSLISVYYGNNHYILNDLNVLLSKARGAVENLEEQKAEIELILKRFDSLEISSLVSTKDLAQVIDKIILFFRDCETAATYTAELGTYGETLKTRYSIALSGLREELNNLIRDYNRFFDMNKVVESIKDLKVPTMDKSIKILNKFARDEDVEMQKTTLLPLGYRIFSKCNLTKDEIENLVSNFKDIKRILYVDSNEIVKLGIDEKNVKSMKSFLSGRVEII